MFLPYPLLRTDGKTDSSCEYSAEFLLSFINSKAVFFIFSLSFNSLSTDSISLIFWWRFLYECFTNLLSVGLSVIQCKAIHFFSDNVIFSKINKRLTFFEDLYILVLKLFLELNRYHCRCHYPLFVKNAPAQT